MGAGGRWLRGSSEATATSTPDGVDSGRAAGWGCCSSSGLQSTHCDSGKSCPPHQSPSALNAGIRDRLHRVHNASGTPCPTHCPFFSIRLLSQKGHSDSRIWCFGQMSSSDLASAPGRVQITYTAAPAASRAGRTATATIFLIVRLRFCTGNRFAGPEAGHPLLRETSPVPILHR